MKRDTAKAKKVTVLEFAKWLADQEPVNMLGHPTQHVLRGGAEHFGVLEKRIAALYDSAVMDGIIVQCRRVVLPDPRYSYQWGGEMKMGVRTLPC